MSSPRRALRWADPANPDSASARFRARRWDKLVTSFPDLADMTVLDLGGTVAFWQGVDTRPADLTVVNLDRQPAAPGCRSIRADACEWQPDRDFDLVISNSLIEHLGGPQRRQQFADVVTQAAPRHWVQTPYRYFPIEPHWVFPGFQFLPLSTRVFITRHWRHGHIHQTDPQAALEECLMVELLTGTEMKALFPDSELWFEKVAGLPKSIVAIKGR